MVDQAWTAVGAAGVAGEKTAVGASGESGDIDANAELAGLGPSKPDPPLRDVLVNVETIPETSPDADAVNTLEATGSELTAEIMSALVDRDIAKAKVVMLPIVAVHPVAKSGDPVMFPLVAENKTVPDISYWMILHLTPSHHATVRADPKTPSRVGILSLV